MRVNDLENFIRLVNLIMHGLPEPMGPSTQPASPHFDTATTKLVLDVCLNRLGLNWLGLDLMESDISTAHRIFSPNKDKHRPELMRFTLRCACSLVFMAMKSLHLNSSPSVSTPIYINEHLIKHSANIYSHAKKLVKEKENSCHLDYWRDHLHPPYACTGWQVMAYPPPPATEKLGLETFS